MNCIGIAYQNPETMYKLMFKAGAETLKELAEDKKYLGAEIGFFGILHTWGQNLSFHPHLHFVVTGGGLSKTNKWVEKETDFFIPVKVIAKKFRGKCLSYIKSAKLNFYGENKNLEEQKQLNKLIAELYKKDWISYCKEPFKNANCVIEYLGKYTHRVAISNYRILKVDETGVTFRWKDYKDNNKIKKMTISVHEFIRRFLIHILPPKFMKIRYYGILGNRNKKEKLLRCKILTRTKIIKKVEASKEELFIKMFGENFAKCPECKVRKDEINE